MFICTYGSASQRAFSQADPQTALIYEAAALCSTYIFRPIGALIFGWLGDNIGRKSTIIITTLLITIACFIMANLQLMIKQEL
ncbi:MFS transporter [Rickettsia conorii]|uniref:MFS transporter n=1 Tax=Rickettsia conorii TaxID=781 RepID=UPI002B408EDB|nr:MFS transporter [Rickettsia conorii]